MANDKLVALIAPEPRRPAVRARRPLDRPQPAGHARPPARGVSPQGAGRRRRPQRRGRRQRSRGLQAGRARQAAAIRRPTRARACSIISTIRDATLAAVARGEAPERGDFLSRRLRSPAAPQSRPHPGAAVPRRATAGGVPRANHQGRHARSRQLDAGNRLPAGRPAAGPAAALRRRVQLRRPARGRRRPLLLRSRPAAASANSARSSTWPTPASWAWSTNGWASTWT